MVTHRHDGGHGVGSMSACLRAHVRARGYETLQQHVLDRERSAEAARHPPLLQPALSRRSP